MNRKITRLSSLCTMAILAFSGQQALATDMNTSPIELSGTISLYSDYVFRGVTQTGETPAIQGSFDLSHDSGLYAGIWASNVDFGSGDDANIEIDYYGGFSGHIIDDLGYDIGAAYYTYPGVDSGLDYDYTEIYGSLTYDLGIASIGAGVYYSPEFFGGTGDALYTYATAEAPISHGFSINAKIGYQEVDDNASFGLPDYTDWSVGLSYDPSDLSDTFEGFTIGIDYTDTNISTSDCADGCDSKVIAYISKTF